MNSTVSEDGSVPKFKPNIIESTAFTDTGTVISMRSLVKDSSVLQLEDDQNVSNNIPIFLKFLDNALKSLRRYMMTIKSGNTQDVDLMREVIIQGEYLSIQFSRMNKLVDNAPTHIVPLMDLAWKRLAPMEKYDDVKAFSFVSLMEINDLFDRMIYYIAHPPRHVSVMTRVSDALYRFVTNR